MATAQTHIKRSAKHRSYAKSVGSYVPGLTRKSFEKYGFSTATLLTDWATIAGQDLASFTLPERLKWPRNVEAFEESSGNARGRPGATLVLRVDGPRAIEVQYQSAQIIERINAHFGYLAVGDVRFIQAPLPKRRVTSLATPPASSAQNRQPTTSASPKQVLGASESRSCSPTNSELLAALDRLHTNMTRAKSR